VADSVSVGVNAKEPVGRRWPLLLSELSHPLVNPKVSENHLANG
jgi:hypothetical protein